MNANVKELSQENEELKNENDMLLKQLCKMQIAYENLYRNEESHYIIFNNYVKNYLSDNAIYGYELYFHPLVSSARFVLELLRKENKRVDKIVNPKELRKEFIEIINLINDKGSLEYADIEKKIEEKEFKYNIKSYLYDLLSQKTGTLDKKISSIYAKKSWENHPKDFRLKKYSFKLYDENANNALLSFIILAILGKNIKFNNEEKAKTNEIEQHAREMLSSEKYIETNQKLKKENIKLKTNNQKLREDLSKEKIKFVNINSNLAEKFGDLLNEFCSVKKNQDILVKKIINVRN